MYSQFRTLGLRAFVVEELPALGVSLVFAELFFKFHSFTLECLAFLATWFCVSWVGNRLTGRNGR